MATSRNANHFQTQQCGLIRNLQKTSDRFPNHPTLTESAEEPPDQPYQSCCPVKNHTLQCFKASETYNHLVQCFKASKTLMVKPLKLLSLPSSRQKRLSSTMEILQKHSAKHVPSKKRQKLHPLPPQMAIVWH